jgi:16S rRNA (cytosine967-C5)-methyltransferase
MARKVSAQVVVADAAEWLGGQAEPFDVILIDAPCTSSGTIRKHPEIAWILGEEDICRLAGAQARLLEAAIPKLAPGGLLIYSVCSWFPQEGVDHLSRLLHGGTNIRPAAVWPSCAFGSTFGPASCSTHIFCPDPLTWEGEGFQAFALTMD